MGIGLFHPDYRNIFFILFNFEFSFVSRVFKSPVIIKRAPDEMAADIASHGDYQIRLGNFLNQLGMVSWTVLGTLSPKRLSLSSFFYFSFFSFAVYFFLLLWSSGVISSSGAEISFGVLLFFIIKGIDHHYAS